LFGGLAGLVATSGADCADCAGSSGATESLSASGELVEFAVGPTGFGATLERALRPPRAAAAAGAELVFTGRCAAERPDVFPAAADWLALPVSDAEPASAAATPDPAHAATPTPTPAAPTLSHRNTGKPDARL